jgi:iron complex outermembrane recepter protein
VAFRPRRAGVVSSRLHALFPMRRRTEVLLHRVIRAAALVACAASAVPARALSVLPPDDPNHLAEMSIEDLANLQVVTVSGRGESSGQAAGAVHVITADDIRLSGVSTLPDALRLAPGLQASRIDADEWAVAIRGFASRLSRSVLVVVDGRSVWSPLFAGVFWDAQDALLQDVALVEVSRGPGGAVYGANALNGVISITSKPAAETRGGLATLGGGSTDRLAGLRWGAALGTRGHYRLYGKYAVRDGTHAATPAGYDDEWTMAQGGFRADFKAAGRDFLTISGDLYDGSSGQPTTVATFLPPFSSLLLGDAAFRGHNLLGRWRRTLAGAGELTTQVYYDHTTRREPHYSEDRDTVDLDARHRLRWGGRHDAVWGLAYRASRGRFEGVPTLQIEPGTRTDDIASVFANDEARFAGDRLRLTAGTKLEWNDYSGWNVQPSARAAWTGGRHTVWASATRAVRTSSRIERDILIYTSLSATQPLFARTEGSADFEPESVRAIEAGYKTWFRSLLISASAFRNRYLDLASNQAGAPRPEAGVPPEPLRVVVPVRIVNGAGGRASGIEASVLFTPRPWLRAQGAYGLLRHSLDGPAGAAFKSNSPRHQVWMTSSVSPRSDVDASLVFRAVGPIPGHRVPGFRELDARLAYRPWSRVEVAAVGQNLLHDRHQEFGGGFEVERGARIQATLRF